MPRKEQIAVRGGHGGHHRVGRDQTAALRDLHALVDVRAGVLPSDDVLGRKESRAARRSRQAPRESPPKAQRAGAVPPYPSFDRHGEEQEADSAPFVISRRRRWYRSSAASAMATASDQDDAQDDTAQNARSSAASAARNGRFAKGARYASAWQIRHQQRREDGLEHQRGAGAEGCSGCQALTSKATRSISASVRPGCRGSEQTSAQRRSATGVSC